MRHLPKAILLPLALLGLITACSTPRAIDRFSKEQEKKIHRAQEYDDAEFNFSAAVYEPTIEDIERMRAAWTENGAAFPESKAFAELERETQKGSQKMVLVMLFMTAYDQADLKDASLGWSISPVPQNIKEIPETDQVIRTLMPTPNPWARVFLLRYTPESLSAVSQYVIGNSTSSVHLKR